MIEAIGVRNFQGFAGGQEIRTAPITLVFGPNASGKTSILRALKLFRQSMSRGVEHSSRGFTYDGDLINLVSFTNTVFGQGTYQEDGAISELAVGLTFKLGELTDLAGLDSVNLTLFDVRPDEVDGDAAIKSALRISVALQTGMTFGLTIFEDLVDFGPTPENVYKGLESLASLNPGLEPLVWEHETDYSDDPDDWLLDDPDEDSTWAAIVRASVNWNPQMRFPIISRYDAGSLRVFTRSARLDALAKVLEDPKFEGIRSILEELPETVVYTRNDRVKVQLLEMLFRDASFALTSNLANVTSTAPLREIPSRTESIKTGTQKRWDIPKVNEWVQFLTQGRYSVHSDNQIVLPGLRLEVLHNYVQDAHTGAQVSFDQVGMGLSQLVPIVEQVFTRPDGELTDLPNFAALHLIEQPELHLHPKMQSGIADMLIDAVTNNEWKTQVIVETHSENILLRIQKRIREGTLDPEMVSIVYVEGSERLFDENGHVSQHNIMYNIELSRNGDVIDPFPETFADLRIQDLL
jgi:predicted ATPase